MDIYGASAAHDYGQELREGIVEVMSCLEHRGLNTGSTGNVSARIEAGFLVTPTGVEPSELRAESIVPMTSAGEVLSGDRPPSSEWRIHADVYRRRPEVNAVVHVHSDYATALACAQKSIPAFHYMVALAGGDSIRCAPYATFGTQALSDAALEALAGRLACLLANHGMLALGVTLRSAMQMAFQVETLARHYWLALQAGGVTTLGAEEMSLILEKFKTYGRQTR